ncbi:hypothetical protein X907_0913 [Glycocaulis alkaliphilus]|uniref:Uncharacterized protein n=1 Tax=Glycocaulis alkaliphilus TaxID=1434191 RepID=A0A3T0E830_9PROT|nr:hypothetical protein X907_0913 [Glycocaulis alkaliphilus]
MRDGEPARYKRFGLTELRYTPREDPRNAMRRPERPGCLPL